MSDALLLFVIEILSDEPPDRPAPYVSDYQYCAACSRSFEAIVRGCGSGSGY
ncbi:hypothetical protein L226DRAFT_538528 [Lentinus tigrinus ALCF2SS1-7]|uniref:Uncharacterized protein n=1 Tax=Lentinus tigrinus ALCF2SS1-6 TaxID=1328759 RepID=A0A5C2S9L2_9APHY|nr:hypothetical protein L227DRAFT_575469 [Lentinus tigrinus ALCF2SS1-6]RPD70929.1 hypothetical protein L226DRAFT_538528 [Lentinus tigrinus ALCF2SS1-7]